MALLAIACVIANSTALSAAQAADYSFRVHNTTEDRITKILVSEHRKSWGYFKIGKGIKPGDSVKLVWDKITNDQGCDQWVKAVFEDDTESKPSKLDFCEKNLEIEF